MTDRPLAAPPNIRRNTTTQRQFEQRVAADVRELNRGFHGEETSLELSLLRARLLEASSSPYYQEVLAIHGLGIRDFERFEDFAHFPLTDRATLGDVMAQMPASFAHSDDVVAVKSSGTTGKPVRVLRGRYETLYMWTVLRFFCSRVNVTPEARPRVVLLDTLPGGLEYSLRAPLFFNGALHRISALRTDAAERLERVKPFAVFTDPAGLHWLQTRRPEISPAVVLTSAQYFGEAQRAAFGQSYPAPVINYYSTTETGPIAWECLVSTGTFHTLSPHVHVEASGGEVLVTRLRSGAFPLLRYATGDRATLNRGTCQCGFQGASLTDFQGRRQCAFVREDGMEVDAWQLAWLFKQHTLQDFCLTQVSVNEFELRGADSPALLVQLVAALKVLGFSSPSVTASAEPVHPVAKPEPFRSIAATARPDGPYTMTPIKHGRPTES